jgi:fermentation-respiration switch protein FrsA (DUF1100 family)
MADPEPVTRKMISILVTVVVGLVFLNLWMYLQQPVMTFMPFGDVHETPSDWGLQFEDVYLDTGDGVRLHGWYVPHSTARGTLLFFHGNAGNVSHRRDSIEIFHRLGLNVFILDYRGYGRSEGWPSEAGLYRDAETAWSHLTGSRGIAPAEIIVFGRSLGGAVAAQLAARVQPGVVILESSFNSARDVARALFPLLSRLVFLRYEFPVAAHLARVERPALILHSPDDEIMPYRLGERLFAAAREPKQLVTLQGDHNGGFLLSQPRYEQALDAFLSAHLRGTD